NSNKLTSTDADGHVTSFVYDPANRLKSRTEGVGTTEAATTTDQYDHAGNQTEELDQRTADLGLPFSVKRTYDALNRLETPTDAEAHFKRYGYDDEGNRTSMTDELQQVTHYDYDELGKLRSVTQPPVELASGGTTSPVTSYGYDETRNRIRQTESIGDVVNMDYVGLNGLSPVSQRPG